jgi:excisionase family DNA binding protein
MGIGLKKIFKVFPVSDVSTIYKLAQDGKVPAVKVGKHWRFMKKDLDHLFEQNKEKPIK